MEATLLNANTLTHDHKFAALDEVDPRAFDIIRNRATVHRKNKRLRHLTLTTIALSVLLSAGAAMSNIAGGSDMFDPCPSSPNCVSSEASTRRHYVAPFRLAIGEAEGWRSVRRAVADLPRTSIVDEGNYYVHAECRSRLFGFVDDLELRLVEPQGIVAIRSSARVGYSDLGVNRKRVERLRQELIRRGIIE